eukprot:11100-Heterococcus_DN1.PRE.1
MSDIVAASDHSSQHVILSTSTLTVITSAVNNCGAVPYYIAVRMQSSVRYYPVLNAIQVSALPDHSTTQSLWLTARRHCQYCATTITWCSTV